MNLNTIYIEAQGRNVSIVVPITGEEALKVIDELDEFCLDCPADNSVYDNCEMCPVLLLVERLYTVFNL